MSMDREDFESDEAWKNYLDQQMTKTYSAADFANAQFAEHPDGRLAHRVEYGTVFAWSFERNDADDYAADEYMAEHGWVPVIPARTIHDRDVEALCADTASYERDDYLDGFIRGFQKAGGIILEETTRERVARLVNEAVDGRGIVPVGEKVADRLINLGLVKDN